MNLIKQILSTALPLEKVFNVSILVYRVLIAFAIIRVHGLKKVLDIEGELTKLENPLGIDPLLNVYLAIAVNLLFSLFVALGFLTRPFALGIMGLTVMGFFVHIHDPWIMRDAPMMYSFAFGLIFVFGPGRYSVDHYLSTRFKA